MRGVVLIPLTVLGSSEQPGEFARGNDPRGFVSAKDQQAALVAGYEVIGLAAFGQS